MKQHTDLITDINKMVDEWRYIIPAIAAILAWELFTWRAALLILWTYKYTGIRKKVLYKWEAKKRKSSDLIIMKQSSDCTYQHQK